MCNENTFLGNSGQDDSSSLVNLLDKFSEYNISEHDINITHSKYVIGYQKNVMTRVITFF